MTNFTHKMALMEFQVHSASKICHLKDVVKICVTNIILSRIEEQVEIMIKSGTVENRQTTQGLAPFCFSHQNILFFFLVFAGFILQTSNLYDRIFSFSTDFNDHGS